MQGAHGAMQCLVYVVSLCRWRVHLQDLKVLHRLRVVSRDDFQCSR